MKINEILSRIQNVIKQGNNEYTGKCPAHDDQQNSLSIGEGTDERILLHCHAGCSTENIVLAIGITLADLYPEKEQKAERKVIAEYLYKDLTGKVIHKTIRFEPKGFTQCRPDGKGSWIYNLKDIKTVLYNLQRVSEAINNGEIVYIVEGEKDVDNLAKLGLTATTSPQGAGKWKDYYSDYLTNSIIAIIPDNDTIGKSHSEQVAKSLYSKAKSIKVIDLTRELSDLPPKGDITDFFRKLGRSKGIEALKRLVDNTEEWMQQHEQIEKTVDVLDSISASELQQKELPPTQFIINNFLSVGLHIIAGSPKIGKSWLMISLCLLVAKGKDVWGMETQRGTTVYLALEDSPNRIKSRMNKVLQDGQAPENVHFIFKAPPIDDGLQEGVRQLLKKYTDTKLLIIDTFAKIRKCSRNDGYQNDYKDTTALKSLADEYGIAILLVHHLRKAKSEDPFETVSGTTGIIGAADGIFVIQKQERQSTEATLHVTGRDIEQMEMLLKFNKNNCIWELISSDAESYKEESKFNKDALMIFLKGFINESNQHWEGGTSELFVEMMRYIEEIDTDIPDIPRTPAALGKKLNESILNLKRINILFRSRRIQGKSKISLQYVHDVEVGSSRWGEVAADINSENADISKVCSSSSRSSSNIQEIKIISLFKENVQENEICPHNLHLPPLALGNEGLRENESPATRPHLPPLNENDEILSGDDAIDFLRKGGTLEI